MTGSISITSAASSGPASPTSRAGTTTGFGPAPLGRTWIVIETPAGNILSDLVARIADAMIDEIRREPHAVRVRERWAVRPYATRVPRDKR